MRVTNSLSLERTREASFDHVDDSTHEVPKAIALICLSLAPLILRSPSVNHTRHRSTQTPQTSRQISSPLKYIWYSDKFSLDPFDAFTKKNPTQGNPERIEFMSIENLKTFGESIPYPLRRSSIALAEWWKIELRKSRSSVVAFRASLLLLPSTPLLLSTFCCYTG